MIVQKVLKHVAMDSTIIDKEEALRTYLEHHVVPLWPPAWMNARYVLLVFQFSLRGFSRLQN